MKRKIVCSLFLMMIIGSSFAYLFSSEFIGVVSESNVFIENRYGLDVFYEIDSLN